MHQTFTSTHFPSQSDAQVIECSFIGAISTTNGGAIYSTVPMVVKDSFFSKCSANYAGGAIFTQSEIFISRCCYERCSSSIGIALICESDSHNKLAEFQTIVHSVGSDDMIRLVGHNCTISNSNASLCQAEYDPSFEITYPTTYKWHSITCNNVTGLYALQSMTVYQEGNPLTNLVIVGSKGFSSILYYHQSLFLENAFFIQNNSSKLLSYDHVKVILTNVYTDLDAFEFVSSENVFLYNVQSALKDITTPKLIMLNTRVCLSNPVFTKHFTDSSFSALNLSNSVAFVLFLLVQGL